MSNDASHKESVVRHFMVLRNLLQTEGATSFESFPAYRNYNKIIILYIIISNHNNAIGDHRVILILINALYHRVILTLINALYHRVILILIPALYHRVILILINALYQSNNNTNQCIIS